MCSGNFRACDIRTIFGGLLVSSDFRMRDVRGIANSGFTS